MNKDLYRAALNEIHVNENKVKELAEKMKEKPKKSMIIGRYGIIAAGIAVLLIAVIIIKGNGGAISGKSEVRLSEGSSVTLPQGKGTIYTNKLEGKVSGKLLIPEGSISKDYTMEQLAEFFGRNPLPGMPEGFKLEGSGTNIIFDPQGKMIFMSPLVYSKDIENPDAPQINIKLNKDALPPKDCIYTSAVKESTIGSTRVVVGVSVMDDKFNSEGKPTSSYDLYSAQFIYNGIGYDITATRIDGQTFLDLLTSIIK